ncbi:MULTISPECIES: L-arabinose ABC transporter ATP-binding protein AraG [Pseudomonas]|jgi:L-arabinose transport system ATP-binding protein|uniref:L-arabinose ABC transporter ATP-binding protein AraG n=1 Tax=Pseudomonas TaxID=286 RepID=UPI000281CC1C|nr:MULTISPECIES: L-arabinose ABC transporter ATP-binding protein AraG [Pseudomonas]MDP9063380.1 L-arabinose ABC transporter ATP-binding protein AraG [Pseudomonadota bacterium]AUO24887.1 xylose ABC transporter ATP-binding protein [Pseudomonas sp. NC02]MDE1910510.1 L-arabinose ABC transporter ATP-binding protein AraG [Pseudomonas sp.]MDE2034952.1 L-arabinose ABC transporter ATP-binding protein AraG [Pseudomonas sp.]MDE2189937.1 L-arabinose ABC transporter ATP-binding protein AraG [Pseudomonas sp|eukprot:gene22279-34157_t
MNSAAAESLRFNGIGKEFPGVKALAQISFEARPHSVHALMGENGAGKSTLLKILGGFYPPNSGSLQLGERSVSFKSAADSIASGIAVIHQELQLVPEMTVAENLLLGHMPSRFGVVNRGAMVRKARELLKGLADEIDPNMRLGSLSLGQRQLVEIAKAMSRNAHVIAFDEPTSSLSAREIERLMVIIARLRDEGRVILYVSHRMEEVFRICDAVTVFKDGRFVRTFEDMTQLNVDQLVNCMVGRDIQDIYDYRPREHCGEALRVEGLLGPGLQEPVSLQVNKGEILGLFGLVGAGRTELLRLLAGLSRSTQGTLVLHGQAQTFKTPRDAIAAGVLLCPEDRKKEGIVPRASVAENINISARRDHARFGWLIQGGWERTNAQRQISALNVRTPSADQPILFLSGGNQQKAILGRWLSMPMKVLLLDEPTRGIDIGAKSEIYQIIHNLAASGIAVIVVSSDLMEVMGISDRILVMSEGALTGELTRDQADEARLLQLALPRTRD